MSKRIYTLEAKKKKASPPVTDDSNPSENQPFNTVSYLHDAIGNQQIQQLYKEGRIQSLLKANQPHNSYEIEANRVASLLASSSKATVDVKQRTSRPGIFAKLISAPDKMKKKQEEQELVAEKIKNLPGKELDSEDKEFFDSRFNQNFDQVKLHTGLEAEQMTDAIGAKAFTMDKDIVFGKDQLAPDTAEGKELLAHELTHVMQQSPEDASAESEAETTADAPTEEEKDQEQAGAAPEEEPKQEVTPPVDKEAATTEASGANDTGQASGEAPIEAPEEPGQPSPSREQSGGGVSLGGGGGRGGGGSASNELADEAPSLTADNSADLLSSVSQAPGSKMLASFNQVMGASDSMLQQESKAAEKSLPLIKAPSGLPEAETAVGMQVKAPTFNLTPPGELKEGAGSQSSKLAADVQTPDFTGKQSFSRTDAALSKMPEDRNAQSAQTEKAIANVQLDGEQVPASLGAPPSVSLTGSADPARMGSYKEDSQASLNEARETALCITAEDFGEGNIFPEKDNTLIQARTELKTRQLSLEKEATDKLPAVPGELTAEVDKEMAEVMKPKLAEQEAKYAEAQAKYEQDAEAAHAENDARVAKLEDETRAEQAETQAKAQSEIDEHKSDFHAEAEKVDAEFKENSQAASAEYQGKVSEEKNKGEASASRHFSEAEKKAESEKSKAESKVAAEKAKAKEEKKSLWDNICDAVGSFVDKLKSAVSAIFEGLRALVKGIFEVAKKLALAAIDVARAAITGLIKVFGTLLKGLIKVAFAAFPKLQKALLDKIDKAINKALDAVNKLADMLKKGVAAAFDFLAKVIDTILGMVQAAYEAALEAIKFIVRGEFGELAKYIFKAALRIIGTGLKEFMAMLGLDTSALDKIIEDPIGFLRNLIDAVKGGVGAFVKNIVPHLTNGMTSWLFGTFQGAAGIMLPQSFDLSGMLFFLLQIFNLTWASLRGQIVKEMGPDGEATMGAAEKSLDFVTELMTKGPIAIVDRIKEFVGNIKDTFFGAIIEWLRNTLIIKGIQKLIMFLNPAGAILAAVQAIYNIVKFFIERWQQIQSFCQAVMNSIKEIAAGAVGTAVGWIEQSLARFIPVTMGFLANFIGLGGIVDKVKAVIQKIRAPIDKAVGKAVGFIAKKIKNSKIFKKVKGLVDKGKKKVEDWKEKRKAKKEEKRKAKEEKEKNKKEKPEELDADDRKAHKQYATEIIRELKKEGGVKDDTFEIFYKKKKELAASLETTYQNRLKRGINLDIKMESQGSAKKDNDISVTVKIAPNTTTVTDELERAGGSNVDFKEGLKNADPAARKDIEKIINKNENVFKDLKNWEEAKGKLMTLGAFTKIYDKPLDKNSNYGKSMFDSASTTLFRTAQESSNKQIDSEAKAQKTLSRKKAKIYEGADPYGSEPLANLRATIFDVSQKSKVFNSLRMSFLKDIGKNIFEPKLVQEFDMSNEKKGLVYQGYQGRKFTIVLDAKKRTEKILGANLKLKPAGLRGNTGKDKAFISNMKFNSAHLIADWFGAPGQSRGYNVMTTSEHYNKEVMLGVEERIVDNFNRLLAQYQATGQLTDIYFNMGVSVERENFDGDDNYQTIVNLILQQELPNYDDKKEVEAYLRDFYNKHKEEAKLTLTRVKNVHYKVIYNVDLNGKKIVEEQAFDTGEPDIWLGLQ